MRHAGHQQNQETTQDKFFSALPLRSLRLCGELGSADFYRRDAEFAETSFLIDA
jgi:hypothetical protein